MILLSGFDRAHGREFTPWDQLEQRCSNCRAQEDSANPSKVANNNRSTIKNWFVVLDHLGTTFFLSFGNLQERYKNIHQKMMTKFQMYWYYFRSLFSPKNLRFFREVKIISRNYLYRRICRGGEGVWPSARWGTLDSAAWLRWEMMVWDDRNDLTKVVMLDVTKPHPQTHYESVVTIIPKWYVVFLLGLLHYWELVFIIYHYDIMILIYSDIYIYIF